MDFLNQRMVDFESPIHKYQIKDVAFPSFIIITSIWLFIVTFKKWKATHGIRRPSTPDLEKKASTLKPKDTRKPGGMFFLGQGTFTSQNTLTPCPILHRMDTIVIQKTTGSPISRLGHPYNKTYPLSTFQIWTVSYPQL